PLALGRSQRLASKGQTMALIARDAGCSFPGCTHPPAWCDRHHILDWILGGPTDLDNLTLLCRYHHTHFLQKGWTCRINTDGLPEWIPPWWIDQDQQPRINTRIQRLNTQRQLDRRDRRRTPAAA
ncbi:MAG: HNH endonuclease signature motif containing protein, partial [Propionibacteriaceae bacterium]